MMQDAIVAYEKCMELQPDSRNAGQNRLLALNYIHQGEDPWVCREHERWGAEFQGGFEALPPPEVAGEDPNRRLVVGYVSPDFFTHSVSYFAEAPLTHHNPDRSALSPSLVSTACNCDCSDWIMPLHMDTILAQLPYALLAYHHLRSASTISECVLCSAGVSGNCCEMRMGSAGCYGSVCVGGGGVCIRCAGMQSLLNREGLEMQRPVSGYAFKKVGKSVNVEAGFEPMHLCHVQFPRLTAVPQVYMGALHDLGPE